jgi:hypothetical protein
MDEKFDLPIRILHNFAEKLEILQIPYMLSGSTAMMHYSAYRLTADIDIVVELGPDKETRLFSVLEPEYYVPRDAVRRAISSKRMFNVIHTRTAYKVDCIIKKTSKFQTAVFDRRRKVDFWGKDIWIITAEDLILSKLVWAKDSKSEMQFKDIKNLMRTDYDRSYVERWLDELGIREGFELIDEGLTDE